MAFVFSEKKVAQAAGFLLSLEPANRTEYMRILKLLYMADRNSLKETRRTITGDEVYSMDFGPVLSQTYNIVKKSDQTPEWNRIIRRDGYFLELRGPVETGTLSSYERRKLREVSEECRGSASSP